MWALVKSGIGGFGLTHSYLRGVVFDVGHKGLLALSSNNSVEQLFLYAQRPNIPSELDYRSKKPFVLKRVSICRRRSLR